VAPAWDALKAHPASAISPKQLRARIGIFCGGPNYEAALQDDMPE